VCFALSSQVSHRPQLDEHEKTAKPIHDEHNGGPSWQPSSPTVVYVGTVPFGLAVIEMTEAILMRHVNGEYVRESEYNPPRRSRQLEGFTWTATKNIPCGRLRLVVYSPYRDVSWYLAFQETVERTLTQNIAKIVKSIESSTGSLQKHIEDAVHRAQIREQQWEHQQERWRHEEDQRQIAKSIRESGEQLNQVIESWAKVVSVERFFKGVEERASTLSEMKRQTLQERLRLAREFLGEQDPFEFFLSWKTPTERYVPLASGTTTTGHPAR